MPKLAVLVGCTTPNGLAGLLNGVGGFIELEPNEEGCPNGDDGGFVNAFDPNGVPLVGALNGVDGVVLPKLVGVLGFPKVVLDGFWPKAVLEDAKAVDGGGVDANDGVAGGAEPNGVDGVLIDDDAPKFVLVPKPDALEAYFFANFSNSSSSFPLYLANVESTSPIFSGLCCL